MSFKIIGAAMERMLSSAAGEWKHATYDIAIIQTSRLPSVVLTRWMDFVLVLGRDREVLASWVRSPSIRAGFAQWARIVLLAADGARTTRSCARPGAKPTVIA